MAQTEFKFDLEPKLIAVTQEREDCERTLQELNDEKERAAEKVVEQKCAVVKISQQILRRHENLVPPPGVPIAGLLLAERGRYLECLEDECQRQRRLLDQEARTLRLVECQIESWLERHCELNGQTDALERLRERRRRRFLRGRLKVRQQERDEQESHRWNRRVRARR